MTQKDRMIVCLGCEAVNRVPAAKSLAAAKCGRCRAPLATPHPVAISNDQMRLLEAKDTGAFIVDLWAPWCGPCRVMAPAYESAAASLEDQVRFFKINTDQHADAAVRLNLRGIPTLIAWNSGQRIANQPGAQTGPALERWIRNLFGLASISN